MDKKIFNGSIVIDKRKYEFIVMLIEATTQRRLERSCPNKIENQHVDHLICILFESQERSFIVLFSHIRTKKQCEIYKV